MLTGLPQILLPRRYKSCVLCGLLFAALTVPGSMAFAADGAGGFVRPGMKVAEILADSTADDRRAAARTGWVDDAMLQRLALAAVVVSTLLCGFVFLARRWHRAQPSAGGSALEIVSRVSLSPKHSVLLVRARGRELVLGVCGDSLTLLSPAPIASDAGGAVLDAVIHSPSPIASTAQSTVVVENEPSEVAEVDSRSEVRSAAWEMEPSKDGPRWDREVGAEPAVGDFLAADSMPRGRAGSDVKARTSMTSGGGRGTGLLDRVDTLDRGLRVGPFESEGLEPYRRQVDRLRDLLDGWNDAQGRHERREQIGDEGAVLQD